MNISSGIYRLALVIKWGGRAIAGFFVAAELYGLATGTQDNFLGFLFAAIVFGITAPVAWILEGFAKD